MKRLFSLVLFSLYAPLCLAMAPYIQGSQLEPAELAAQLDKVEAKLKSAGFVTLGRHMPKGIPQSGSLVVSDPTIQAAIASIGGSAVVASGIRVGVMADGTVSYMNPSYWYQAFLRSNYSKAQASVRAVQNKLASALGSGQPFGGDVPEADLANYRYMFGMERFDADNSLVATHDSFAKALATVQANLSSQKADTSKVYEVVYPEQKIAVFGVAMNSSDSGEGWWVNKIGGSTHPAALPYELFIVDGQVYSLYARFRIALAWPALGMGQFMGIINAPEAIRSIMTKVASNQ